MNFAARFDMRSAVRLSPGLTLSIFSALIALVVNAELTESTVNADQERTNTGLSLAPSSLASTVTTSDGLETRVTEVRNQSIPGESSEYNFTVSLV